MGYDLSKHLVDDAKPGNPRKQSGGRQSAVNVITPDGAITLSEDTLAAAFETRKEGRLAYLHKFGYWLIFNTETGIWARDYQELVFHWVREFVRGMNAEQSAKWAKAAVAASVEKYARASPGFAFIGDEFDADPWLMGTPGGVIDLRGGRVIAPSPIHYVSKCAAVQPTETPAPLWLEFLAQATGNDIEMVGYLQRLCGYCLTGETSEQILVFIYGTGGNGKGIFMNTLRAVMGEYARQAPMQIFLANNGDRHPTELANLFGARLVLASESPEGRRWDEERIKSLTGGDAISARFMNRDFFEFVPRFKLVVASNHKPRIRTVDDAWRRRLHLVPFIHKPAMPDPDLPHKLKDEYPAILHWMIEGAEWWSREGLSPPGTITKATEDYFLEEDVIGLWFAECCERAASATTERKELYHSFEQWCRGMGHSAATMHSVTRWLKQGGLEQDTTKATRPIVGVCMKRLGTE